VLVSDLESDFSPLSEGIRLAARRGVRVCVIALFSKVFEQFDDPLFEVEDVYAAYEAHRRRVRKLERTPNVKVIEANAAEALQPALKEAQVV
jgi:GTP:adenosylcobinamide-phosphate guanylyltransferase